MKMIRVVIVDDHPIVRTGIRNILERASDIVVVGEASNGAEALNCIHRLHPDVLLLDMEMPGMNGIETMHKISESKLGELKILALSAHNDRQYIQYFLKIGDGYLLKDEALDLIVDAVRGVARGERGWMSRGVIANLSSYLKEDEAQSRSDLTKRELQVLKLLVAAKTNQEIAVKLGISEKTVEKHLENIFNKLDVTSRVMAAVRALQDDLV